MSSICLRALFVAHPHQGPEGLFESSLQFAVDNDHDAVACRLDGLRPNGLVLADEVLPVARDDVVALQKRQRLRRLDVTICVTLFRLHDQNQFHGSLLASG